MISNQLKAQAIARIRHNVPLEDIAHELDIPLMLIKEWSSTLNVKDLVAIESNVYAVQTLLDKDPSAENEARLKSKLEEVAFDIAEETSKAVGYGDPVLSKSLQLCADTVSKLYTVFIAKNNGPAPLEQPSSTGLSLFQNMLRD